VPTRQPDDDYDDHDDDRPRRRRDDDDDRPRRRRRDDGDRPPAKKGGGGRILLILLLVAGGGLALCCGGCGVLMYYNSSRQVTVVDATRTKSPQGGTASVAVNVRVSGTLPGGFVRGDYVFMFKSGTRTSDHTLEISGRNPVEARWTFSTPKLASEPGPVEFWVEKRERDGVSRVSPVHTIP
jgi:hypothetical protein